MKHELSKERLTQAIEQLEHFATNLKWSNVGGAQSMLFAADGLRALLAAHEQEPSGYLRQGEIESKGYANIVDRAMPEVDYTIPVYAHPAPSILAAVPDAMPVSESEDGFDIDYMAPSEVYDLGKADGWNACRAAMLSQPSSTDGWWWREEAKDLHARVMEQANEIAELRQQLASKK